MPVVIHRGEGPTLRVRNDLTVADLEELMELLMLKYTCKHLVDAYVKQVKMEFVGDNRAFIAARMRTEAAEWMKDRRAPHSCELLDEAFGCLWGWLIEVAPVGLDNQAGPRNRFADRLARDIVSLVEDAARDYECHGE